MREEFFWATFAALWIFGWAAVWLVRRRAHDARSAKWREMLHRERLAAIEKDVPLAEVSLPEEETMWLTPEVERARMLWLRRVSLLLGLTSLTAGLGICAGFYWAPDRSFHGMWTIGFIPAMAGVGLLLFYALVGPGDRSRNP